MKMVRTLLVRQTSIGGWKPDTREGCPYISFDHMKLDGVLHMSGLFVKTHNWFSSVVTKRHVVSIKWDLSLCTGWDIVWELMILMYLDQG